jgi:hypothetical protein
VEHKTMTINAAKLTTAMAVRYLDAARVIHKHSPSPNALWEPLNHLFAMAGELALKAFIEGVGVPEKELRGVSVRHSLNALLLLAVTHGLRTSRDVAEAIMEMDEAHSSHFYRYVPRPGESEVITVHSPHPAVAFAAIQRLLDQCVIDPLEVRKHSAFPDDWPAALLPVHPVSVEELEYWIAEKTKRRDWRRESPRQRP